MNGPRIKKIFVGRSAFHTHKNFSLKMVPADGRLRASRPLDPMQAFYLICSFVDEVYRHPSYVAIVMKWGMHEVDASHQLTTSILEPLQLLQQPWRRSTTIPSLWTCGSAFTHRTIAC